MFNSCLDYWSKYRDYLVMAHSKIYREGTDYECDLLWRNVKDPQNKGSFTVSGLLIAYNWIKDDLGQYEWVVFSKEHAFASVWIASNMKFNSFSDFDRYIGFKSREIGQNTTKQITVEPNTPQSVCREVAEQMTDHFDSDTSDVYIDEVRNWIGDFLASD